MSDQKKIESLEKPIVTKPEEEIQQVKKGHRYWIQNILKHSIRESGKVDYEHVKSRKVGYKYLKATTIKSLAPSVFYLPFFRL